MYTDMNEAKQSIENSSPLYRTAPTVIYKQKPKRGPPYRAQELHPRPQTPHEE